MTPSDSKNSTGLKRDRRSLMLKLRVSPAERELIRDRARAASLSVSEFMRLAVLGESSGLEVVEPKPPPTSEHLVGARLVTGEPAKAVKVIAVEGPDPVPEAEGPVPKPLQALTANRSDNRGELTAAQVVSAGEKIRTRRNQKAPNAEIAEAGGLNPEQADEVSGSLHGAAGESRVPEAEHEAAFINRRAQQLYGQGNTARAARALAEAEWRARG